MEQSPTQYLGHTGRVSGVSFSPDGSLLASAGENDMTVRIWRVATGELLHVFSMGEKRWARTVNQVTFSEGGSKVYAHSYEVGLRSWIVATGESVVVPRRLVRKQVEFLDRFQGAFSQSSSDGESVLLIHDLESGRVRRHTFDTQALEEMDECVGFSADHTLLLAGSKLLDVESGKVIRSWDGSDRFLIELPEGPVVALVDEGRATETSVAGIDIIDPRSGQKLWRLEGIWDRRELHSIGSITAIPGTHKLIIWGMSRVPLILDVLNPSERTHVPGSDSYAVSLTVDPLGARIAIGEQSGAIRLVDANTGEVQRTIGGTVRIGSIAVTPSSRYLVSSPPPRSRQEKFPIQVWDLDQLRIVVSSEASLRELTELRVTEELSLLYDSRLNRIVGSGSTELALLEKSRSLFGKWFGSFKYSTSHNGEWLVELDSSDICVYSVRQGKRVWRKRHKVKKSFLEPAGVAVSETGDLTAAGFTFAGVDVLLFDFKRGTVKELRRCCDTFDSLAFSIDGRFLAIGDAYQEDVVVFSLTGRGGQETPTWPRSRDQRPSLHAGWKVFDQRSEGRQDYPLGRGHVRASGDNAQPSKPGTTASSKPLSHNR